MSTYIAWWNADGLAAGQSLTTALAGTGDNHFDNVTIAGTGTLKTKAGGLYTPRLELLPPSTATNLYWYWQASLGSFTNHAVTFYMELAALPTGNAQIFSIRTTANEQLWWFDITAAGILRLRNNAGTSVKSSLQPVPLNTVIRVDATYQHSNGEVWLFLSYGESVNRFEVLHGTGFNLNASGGTLVPAQCRFGAPNTANVIPHMYFDDMIFGTGDISTTLGPINPSTTQGFKLWNGTTEAALKIDGRWNGTTIDNCASVDRIR